MNKRDYIFYLNWEDKEKNSFRVGFLAQIKNDFYLVIRDKEKTENDINQTSAYDKGFIGIPGFIPGRIYKSEELFEFFKSRVLDKKSKDPCQELSETKGVSNIDSFYVEEASEFVSDKYAEALLEAYKKQEELKKLKNKSKEDTQRGA